MKHIFCPHCKFFRLENGYSKSLDVGITCNGCKKVIFPANEKSQLNLPVQEKAQTYTYYQNSQTFANPMSHVHRSPYETGTPDIY